MLASCCNAARQPFPALAAAVGDRTLLDGILPEIRLFRYARFQESVTARVEVSRKSVPSIENAA